MGLFVAVGERLGEAGRFLKERNAMESPLVKARFFQPGLVLAEKLQSLSADLQARRAALLEELKAMNPRWETAPPPGSPDRLAALPMARLDEIYRLLSYFGRWAAQIQERALEISFS